MIARSFHFAVRYLGWLALILAIAAAAYFSSADLTAFRYAGF